MDLPISIARSWLASFELCCPAIATSGSLPHEAPMLCGNAAHLFKSCSSSSTGGGGGGTGEEVGSLMNPFTDLPPELISHLLSFLSAKDTLRVAEVSKLCHHYANDEMVWKGLLHSELGVSFLRGTEHVLDSILVTASHTTTTIDANKLPRKSWKERFQYFVKIQDQLKPTQHVPRRAVPRPSLLPLANDAVESEIKPELGCKHYKRRCRLVASCCGRLVVCRHCHDEQVTDHKIDRYSTQLVSCMVCGAIQPVGKVCMSSQCKGQTPMGKYFCSICKFYDNEDQKAIFHCQFCNVCKLGEMAESFHCHGCGRCFSKAVRPTHPCLKNRQTTPPEER